MKVKVNINFPKTLTKRLRSAGDKAMHIVAAQAMKDTRQYVPMRNGQLDARTYVDGNKLVYPGPYARFLYYGKVMIDPETGSAYARKGATKVVTDKDLVFTTDFHADAQSFWFEASKAQNMEKWQRVAEKAVKEELNG